MPFHLVFTERYEKIERRFLKRHPDLLERYHGTLAILEQNPYYPSLRLRVLQGRLAGLHAVSNTASSSSLSSASRRSAW